jgi:glyoxylase-like metal-dependent hydrolase (beta-lactamase superfamily II)
MEVVDGVYVATNYSFVNVIVIDAPEGLIIVDTSETPETAEAVRSALRQFNKRPIKAIILTHYHFDHVQGIEVSTTS